MLIDIKEYARPNRLFLMTHIGKVISNQDPKKMGRIKCTIEGILEGTENELPWVHAVNPYGHGISQTTANLSVPVVGSEVIIEFKDDDVYNPVYVGYNYNEGNVNSYFDENYPKKSGMVLGDFKMSYNQETDQTELVHPSGTVLKILTDGSIDIDGEQKVNIDAKGDITIQSEATYTVLGKSETNVGTPESITNVNGEKVLLAGGARQVALYGSLAIGLGDSGYPVSIPVIGNMAVKTFGT